MPVRYYSILDVKADSYGVLFSAQSDAVATRLFQIEVNRADPGNSLYLYPEDFTLHYIATFDTETGLFLLPLKTEVLVNGGSLKN